MHTVQRIATTWDGSYEQKELFHKSARSLLNKVAKELGYQKTQFNIRSNKGGPAVLGDVILHSDNLYINLGGSYCNDKFMYRKVKHQKDYTGGTNNWMTYQELCDNFDQAIHRFKHPIP